MRCLYLQRMKQPLSRYLDHAVLKPNMTRTEAEEAINLGLSFNTRTVCIRPTDIELAKSMCRGTPWASIKPQEYLHIKRL